MFYKLLPLIFLKCLFCFCTLFGEQEPVVIIGSGPAGLTAAIYTARAGLPTVIIEGEEAGGQIALSYLVENFPGFPEGINGYELGNNMREQALRFGTKIESANVSLVDLSKRPFAITFESGKQILASALIIATGATPKQLGLPAEKTLLGKGVCTCAVCDGFFFQGKEVVVVGGGDSALEDALFLTNFATKVTVIHRRDTLKASKYLQDKAFAHPKITFIWDSVVDEIVPGEDGKVAGVALKNIRNNTSCVYPCQGVFIAIGHTPNTTLFEGQIDLDEGGYIVTKHASTTTSVDGVFAAGDVADPHYRQAITASGTGCMAGIDAYHFLSK